MTDAATRPLWLVHATVSVRGVTRLDGWERLVHRVNDPAFLRVFDVQQEPVLGAAGPGTHLGASLFVTGPDELSVHDQVRNVLDGFLRGHAAVPADHGEWKVDLRLERAPDGWESVDAPEHMRLTHPAAWRTTDDPAEIVVLWLHAGDVSRVEIDETDNDVTVRIWSGEGTTPDESGIPWGWAHGAPVLSVLFHLRAPLRAREVLDGHYGRRTLVPLNGPIEHGWSEPSPPRPVGHRDLIVW